jgi:hypothetical protein
LSIKDLVEQSARRDEAEGYKLLPNASFAFCRSAASVPPIRICSTLAPEADVGLRCAADWPVFRFARPTC